jgi:hypothetical protein
MAHLANKSFAMSRISMMRAARNIKRAFVSKDFLSAYDSSFAILNSRSISSLKAEINFSCCFVFKVRLSKSFTYSCLWIAKT